MKDECIGIMGKLFGHDYQSKIVKYDASSIQRIRLENASSDDIEQVMDAGANKEYEIVCTRCGKRVG